MLFDQSPFEDSACSRAAAAVDDHARERAVNDIVAIVEVEQRYRRHLGRIATRAGPTVRFCLRDDVRVRVLLKEDVSTLARAEVCPISLGCDHPVPVEVDEIDDERITTTTVFCRQVVAL